METCLLLLSSHLYELRDSMIVAMVRFFGLTIWPRDTIFLYNISLSLVGRISHVTMSATGGSAIENFAGTPNTENLSTWSGSIARLVTALH
jgi:hypothetical protein